MTNTTANFCAILIVGFSILFFLCVMLIWIVCAYISKMYREQSELLDKNRTITIQIAPQTAETLQKTIQNDQNVINDLQKDYDEAFQKAQKNSLDQVIKSVNEFLGVTEPEDIKGE